MSRLRPRLIASLLGCLAGLVALHLAFAVATPPVEVAAYLGFGLVVVLVVTEATHRAWMGAERTNWRLVSIVGGIWCSFLGVGYALVGPAATLGAGAIAGFFLGVGTGLTLHAHPRVGVYYGVLTGSSVGLLTALFVVPSSLASTPPLTGVVFVCAVLFPFLFATFCAGGGALGGWIRSFQALRATADVPPRREG